MKQKKTKQKQRKILTVLCGSHEVRIRESDYARIKKRYGGNTITVKDLRGKLVAYIKQDNQAVPVARVIMKLAVGDPRKIQFKDGNPLNLDKKNLFTLEQSNVMTQRAKIENTSSKYKGVYFDRTARKWKAQINPGKQQDGKKRKNIHLGYFAKEKDAAIAYDKAALQFHGQFATLNILRHGE